MKITAKTLSESTQLVLGAVSSRPVLPILSYVKLSVEGDVLTIAATDLEKFIVKIAKCESKKNWETTIPARLFNDLIAKMPDEIIELDLIDDALIISYGENETELSTLDPAEFPLIPELPENKPVEFECADLLTAFSSVVYAAATDEGRPVLTCVFMDFENNLTLVAADGFRLAVYETNHKSEFENVLIPADAVLELNKLLRKNIDEKVKVYTDNSRAFFVFENSRLICQIVDGNFVTYNQVIPLNTIMTAKCDTAELIRKLELISVIASREVGSIHITFDDDVISLSVTVAGIGTSNENVNAKIEGEFYTAKIDVKFLLDTLRTIDWKTVIIKKGGPSQPFLIHSEGEERKPLAVIMPMQREK